MTRFRFGLRPVAGLVAAMAIVAACVSPGWTAYVYNNRTSAVIVRFATNGRHDDRALGADSQGFVFVGPAKPADAVVTFLDPTTCSVLGTAAELPTQHVLIIFSYNDVVGVAVDDPGDQPRTLAPSTNACP